MRARGGEPCQGQASWRQWKSVAVEAERLGCGERLVCGGEASWIRASAALYPRDCVYGRGVVFSTIRELPNTAIRGAHAFAHP